jgi:hypothetical protein
MADHFITGWGIIRKNSVVIDGKTVEVDENYINFATFIKALYKKEQLNYPKFYKMDNLSKLGFLTAELIFKSRNIPDHYKREEFGVIIANSSSSLDTDIHYQDTISDSTSYYPSPSVFVYTLPNILIGEICIKNRIKGENAFLISKKFDAELMCNYVEDLLQNNRVQACICGWVELLHEDYESCLMIIEKEKALTIRNEEIGKYHAFTKENVTQLYLNTRI